MTRSTYANVNLDQPAYTQNVILLCISNRLIQEISDKLLLFGAAYMDAQTDLDLFFVINMLQ